MAEESSDDSGAMEMMAGGMDMIQGGMKGMQGILEGIFQVVSKLMNSIIDASPMLQGVLKIVDKMFKMILLPIGNLIARLLLPIAIKMANKTMQFLSKYGNAGPDKLEEMMSSGMSIALDSFTDMIGVILTKVMVPILKGLISAVFNILVKLLHAPFAQRKEDYGSYSSVSEDLSTLLGNSATGAASIITQFGMTVQTGNKEIGTSQTELATIFYSGATDIANGFQSLHTVLAIGTPKILAKFETDFNTAAAGVYTSINTLGTSFQNLIDYLDQFDQGDEEEEPPAETTERGKTKAWYNWLVGAYHYAEGSMKGNKEESYMGARMQQGYVYSNEEQNERSSSHYTARPMANGGIINRPVNALMGENGPEAVIPLTKANGIGGQTVHVHIEGDIYGMDDFERKVEKAVGKYSSKIRGAY
jgi:hypothetical protein